MTVFHIFAETAPGQTRLGFFDEAGRITDLWLCRDDEPDLTGTVHHARIEQIFAKQNRARGRLADGTSISLKLPKTNPPVTASGDIAPVTIVAAPRHGKAWQAVFGARLVSAALVLLPGQSGVLFSRKLDDDSVSRLRAMAADLDRPDGFGVIIRRQAAHLDKSALLSARQALVRQWQAGFTAKAPSVLGVLYDGGSLEERAMRSVLAGIYQTCRIDDAHSLVIDKAIADAMSAQIVLPNGGRLWCQRTHALWAIDIDGAEADIERAGFAGLLDEAAFEIARQIRLRGMSGPILVDVPRAGSAVKKFRLALQAHLADDPQQAEILGITHGGLLEIWRPHGGAALLDALADYTAQAALAGLRLAAARPAFKPVNLAVSRRMADWLTSQGAPAVAALQRPLELSICLDDDPSAVAYIIDSPAVSH